MDERKVVCYIATSMDGYIADLNETLDWLLHVEMEGDAGYGKFMESVDVVLLGRRTYDWVMEQENGEFPYSGLQSYVFTSRPAAAEEGVRFTSQDPAEVVKGLKREPGGTIWPVGGSLLLANLLEADLIDEFIVSVVPVLLGDGIPLFPQTDQRKNFSLLEVLQDGQIAQMHFERKKEK